VIGIAGIFFCAKGSFVVVFGFYAKGGVWGG